MGNCLDRKTDVHLESRNEDEGVICIKSENECDPEIEECLQQVPLFASLKLFEKRILGANLQERKIADKKKIITEGEDGNEFFIIKDGICRVLKYNEQKNADTEICQLRKGDYFGEAALLDNTPRAASVEAKGEVIALSLNQKQFQKLFGENRLKIEFGKRKAISAEPYDPEKENKAEHIPQGAIVTKNTEQKKLILKVVNKSILFRDMDKDQRRQVVQHMWLKKVNKGISIIKQGDLGDNFYVIQKGKFDVFIKDGNGNSAQVAHKAVGECFGDLALMHNAPRAATVTAVADSELWSLDRWTFRKILTLGFRDKIQEYEQFLKQVPTFSSLLSQERAKVAEALEEVTFKKGHDIIRENEEGNTFFILKKGEIVAKKKINGQMVEVKRYHSGDFFGERALVKKDVRAATCTTVCESECLYLGRRAFEILLGPLEDMFEKRLSNYHKLNSSLEEPTVVNMITSNDKRSETKEKPSSNNMLMEFRVEDLKIIGTLGRGSFGHVQLVADGNGKTYALKSISKYQICQLGQQEHVVSERNVMASLNHPFLIKLYGTDKDHNKLYFLMEVCLGGELFSVLRSRTYFVETTARFFSAGVVLCFEYMHSKNIIYRDLKPENLLLDEQGYVKITDFGFAKIVHERTWTLCGTPDYLAPEIVSGKGHGKGVDWWTLGILIYEMLASYPPFYDENPMKTYAKIMDGKLNFPMHLTKNPVDLIRGLLRLKPSQRLGVGKGGAGMIKDHVWFQGFDWDSFLSKKLTAPIIQPIKNQYDLANFEEYPEENEQEQVYTVDAKNPNWDADF